MVRGKLWQWMALLAALSSRGCSETCPSLDEHCRMGTVSRFVDESIHEVRFSGGDESPWGSVPFSATLAISIRAQRRVTLTYVRDGRTVIETWRIASMRTCPL